VLLGLWKGSVLNGYDMEADNKKPAARSGWLRCRRVSSRSIHLLMRHAVACTLAILVLLLAAPAQAQQYDLLLKGGHVIDPKNGIDGPMDVAIADGKIARVASDIPAADAERVIDVSGLYVTPGLIDIHTHVFVGSTPGRFADGFSSVSPDDFTFRSGVTTVVDAGTSGWRNFSTFKEQVIDQSRTRVLAFLNIVGYGMRGDPYNQDLGDMDPFITSSIIRQYPELIVGTKIGHFQAENWQPFDRALEAARMADVPLLLECHLPELALRDLLERMRPGDIFTHAFGKVNDRTSVLDERGIVRDYVRTAKEKGIVFDVGHGGGSFHFSQAIPAMKQGLTPDAFGTDLHRGSMNAGMKSMLNVMSKYLNMGMSIEEIILRATWNPARIIQREDLGHLSEGAEADVAVLNVLRGAFGFVDSGGYKINGDQKFEAELTLRAGRIVWDLNGLAAPVWQDVSESLN